MPNEPAGRSIPALLRFRTRHQPYMVRSSYRREIRAALTYPLAAALAEGAFTGVVAIFALMVWKPALWN